MNYKGKKDQIFNCVCCGTEFKFKGYTYRHKYCSIECSQLHKKEQASKLMESRYESWLNGDQSFRRTIVRQFVIIRDGDKCNVCGITEHNGQSISFWCDHIDGNATNNDASNFQMVCPNCDSQQDTFGAKNSGQGRKARGLPMYG